MTGDQETVLGLAISYLNSGQNIITKCRQADWKSILCIRHDFVILQSSSGLLTRAKYFSAPSSTNFLSETSSKGASLSQAHVSSICLSKSMKYAHFQSPPLKAIRKVNGKKWTTNYHWNLRYSSICLSSPLRIAGSAAAPCVLRKRQYQSSRLWLLTRVSEKPNFR